MKTLGSTAHLKKLLIELKTNQPKATIRLRKLGKGGWYANPLTIVMITQKGVIFNDKTIDEFVNVADLSEIRDLQVRGPSGPRIASLSFD